VFSTTMTFGVGFSYSRPMTGVFFRRLARVGRLYVGVFSREGQSWRFHTHAHDSPLGQR